MVDITMKLYELNIKLRGKGVPAYALLEEVVCFEKKLLIFSEDMESGRIRQKIRAIQNKQKYSRIIVNPLNTNTHEINIEPFEIDAGSFQMQLLDLKNKDLWSDKFIEFKKEFIFDTWNSLLECYSEMKKLAFGVLAIFGSTYSCEQAFSCMNTIKNKVRSQLTNKNLESCLKLKTSYEPNFKELSKDMQS
ncbi:hypothetical protein QTP88_028159 [Uroleucon formosanum]